MKRRVQEVLNAIDFDAWVCETFVLLGGTNDIGTFLTSFDIYENLMDVLRQAQKSFRKAVLMTIPVSPRAAAFTNGKFVEKIRATNDLIRAQHEFLVIDMAEHLLPDDTAMWDVEHEGKSPLHPSENGYRLMGEIVQRKKSLLDRVVFDSDSIE